MGDSEKEKDFEKRIKDFEKRIISGLNERIATLEKRLKRMTDERDSYKHEWEWEQKKRIEAEDKLEDAYLADGFMDKFKLIITELYGERCIDKVKGCPCCDVWELFDKIVEETTHTQSDFWAVGTRPYVEKIFVADNIPQIFDNKKSAELSAQEISAQLGIINYADIS